MIGSSWNEIVSSNRFANPFARDNNLEMDTLIPILGAGAFLIVLERIIPDQKLPHVDGWWLRVVVINVLQLGVVVLAMFSQLRRRDPVFLLVAPFASRREFSLAGFSSGTS